MQSIRGVLSSNATARDHVIQSVHNTLFANQGTICYSEGIVCYSEGIVCYCMRSRHQMRDRLLLKGDRLLLRGSFVTLRGPFVIMGIFTLNRIAAELDSIIYPRSYRFAYHVRLHAVCALKHNLTYGAQR